jgi:hypothetical protein
MSRTWVLAGIFWSAPAMLKNASIVTPDPMARWIEGNGSESQGRTRGPDAAMSAIATIPRL